MNIKGTASDKRDTAATLCKIIRDKRAFIRGKLAASSVAWVANI